MDATNVDAFEILKVSEDVFRVSIEKTWLQHASLPDTPLDLDLIRHCSVKLDGSSLSQYKFTISFRSLPFTETCTHLFVYSTVSLGDGPEVKNAFLCALSSHETTLYSTALIYDLLSVSQENDLEQRFQKIRLQHPLPPSLGLSSG